MKAFLVANPKGGSGKSTLATNLAGYFASQHHEVMLGDIDRQQSSLGGWVFVHLSYRRLILWQTGHDNIARPPKYQSRCPRYTGWLTRQNARQGLKAFNAVIVPVQPSMFDMAATRQFWPSYCRKRRLERVRLMLP